jgi:uncharacterized membrane protein YfcA
MTESLLTALILFGATLISSTFGFGSALFAMPLLTLMLGISTATPLFGLVGPTIASIILARNWRLVELASAWRLVLSTLAGIPVGVWLVTQVPGELVTHLLGAFLVGFALYRLCKWELVKLDSPAWAAPIGFVAGILGGAYNTNGPPIVMYGEMRRWSPREFRATLQSYFLPTGLGILVSHGVAGLWNARVFELYGVSLPGILVAIAIGGWINHRLPTERFQTLLSLLLMLLGILLWL